MLPARTAYSVAAIAAVLATALASSPAHAIHGRWARYAPVLATAESLQVADAAPATLRFLDSVLVVASTIGNQDLRIIATLTRSRALIVAGRNDEGEEAARSLLPQLRAEHDTLGLCRALYALARAEWQRGHIAEGRAGYERSLLLARTARLRGEQGRALVGLGNLEFNAEHYALAAADHGRAIALLSAPQDARARIFARAGRARALQTLGRNEEAKREHLRVIEESRAAGDRNHEADTHFNLGSLELMSGDPASAADQFRGALEVYEQLGWSQRMLKTANALAIIYDDLGRYDEADSVLALALPVAEHLPDPETRAQLLSEMSELRGLQRRYREAVAYGERALALIDSIRVETAIDIVFPLVGTLESMGHPERALALLDREIAALHSRLGTSDSQRLETRRAITLRRMGRAKDALASLQEAAQTWRETPHGINSGMEKLSGLAELAKCYRDLGQRDSAVAWFGRVTDRWEAWRAGTSDPTWREHYDEFARRFSGDYAAAVLDPHAGATPEARARQAFDVLQRFRARTLLDRIVDPAARSAQAPRIITARVLQDRVLEPGEVFLDIHALPDTTFVFVVTKAAIHAYGVHGLRSLSPRLERLRGLFANSGSDGSSLATGAASAIGSEVLGPAADHLKPARRVLIAAGALTSHALDQLALPGERDALIATREVTWVPSAAILADARAARAVPAPRALLAIAQSLPWEGVALPGARREAEWLAQRFAASDAVVDRGAGGDAMFSARAPRYQILHIAGHTRSGGLRPWQDAIRLGNSEGEDAWLTAAEIARLRIPARICVLAGCRTAGNSSATGETLEDLATAWLAAGTRTVIATQWAVDDEATSELMRRFYTRLAAGEGAGPALHGAQLEMRGIPRFARPYYWAGVVLFGDPDTRVTLVPRGKHSAGVTSGL